jgi:deoxycytidylate deaminase
MAANPLPTPAQAQEVPRKERDSRAVILDNASCELVFAVVGYAGSGTTYIANALADRLAKPGPGERSFDVTIIKAREMITAWAQRTGRPLPVQERTLKYVDALQNLGDEMRSAVTADGSEDHAAVARALALRIRKTRAQKTNVPSDSTDPVLPDGTFRAYILDSIRHPAEVEFLRRLYGDAFILIGIVCEGSKRQARIGKKYDDAGAKAAIPFMERDSQADKAFGQQVSKAFHLADFFVDNTPDRNLPDERPNPDWNINEHLSRLVRILMRVDITRPNTSETAMYHAFGAQLRSSCLSRQVGAALVDWEGHLLATGANEVPKAGGGVYAESDTDAFDDRCAHRCTSTFIGCSNTLERNKIIRELIGCIDELENLGEARKAEIARTLCKTSLGRLLEFSRAIHAEMDALISAARKGISPVGTRMFVTTFPCHNCARHLVTAGVDEIQFLEPYPKSQALALHRDAIQLEGTKWVVPSSGEPEAKVWIHPFSGVAPRMYNRAFFKDRDLKDDNTGEMKVGTPRWGSLFDSRRISYPQLEAELAKEASHVK